ncbi:MAG: hypothetical protein Q7S17_09040 [Xanthobacteraceae bacterium]|nr:hypothetical protein [Xanthobacteraceae bacterium]
MTTKKIIETKAPRTSSASTYKTPLSQYITANYSGKNESGWTAVTEHVLVLPDLPMQKIGNIIIPAPIVDQKADAAESGILIELGPDAFIWNSDRTRRLEKEIPKAGSRVVFNRYSGIILSGDDGQTYYILVDHSVKATRPL